MLAAFDLFNVKASCKFSVPMSASLLCSSDFIWCPPGILIGLSKIHFNLRVPHDSLYAYVARVHAARVHTKHVRILLQQQCHAAGDDEPRQARLKPPGATCHTQVLLCGPPWVYVALCPCGSRLTSSADGVIWMLGVPLLLAPLLPTGCAVLLPL